MAALCACLLLAAMPARAQARSDANAAAHEQQLATIRQALLEATLERPTRIVSSAWIDAEGALHEDSSFHSSAEVRGVRMLPYVDDGSAARLAIQAEVLPPGLGATADAGCTPEPTRRNWRLPVRTEARLAAGFVGKQAFASASLLELATQSWSEQGTRSTRWYFVDADPRPQAAYLRALTGAFDAAPAPDWSMVLELSPSAAADEGLFVAPDWARLKPRPWRWTLSLTLLQHPPTPAAAEVRLHLQQVLEVSAEDAELGPNIWQKKYLEPLRTVLQQWQGQLDEIKRCAPVQFPLRFAAADSFMLEAGQHSGLRVGDRMLIMNRTRVPSQMLQAGLSMHMALAEVSQVGPRRTLLKQLAGPPLNAQGDWVALPL